MSNKKRKRNDDDPIKEINSMPFDNFISSHGSPLDTPFVRNETDITYMCILHATKKSKITTNDADKLDDATFEQCLALVETTSRLDYEASSIGWHPKRKRREMLDKDMRYLVVRQSNTKSCASIEGFLSFMFTHEAGKPVMYIYEIHLNKTARGCGLGKHLLNAAEQIAASVGVEQSMLTVFTNNVRTVQLYFKAGYAVDESSPPDKSLRGGKTKQSDYLILSKGLSRHGGRVDTKAIKY